MEQVAGLQVVAVAAPVPPTPTAKYSVDRVQSMLHCVLAEGKKLDQICEKAKISQGALKRFLFTGDGFAAQHLDSLVPVLNELGAV